MTHAEIYRLALASGFKLKEQSDRTMDLNPYVYRFAEALLEQGRQVATYHQKRADRLQAEAAEYEQDGNQWKAAHDELAAHVERLREAVEFCNEHHHFGGWSELLNETPASSLARRDAKVERECLSWAKTHYETMDRVSAGRKVMERMSKARQAEEAPSC